MNNNNPLAWLLSKYPDKGLEWRLLSSNPILTWDIIQKNLDKHFNWYDLSQNPNITWDIVKNNLDKPWVWESLSINPNITPEGNLKLYNINDPSDVEIFELGDIFPVDGKAPAQLGNLSQEINF